MNLVNLTPHERFQGVPPCPYQSLRRAAPNWSPELLSHFVYEQAEHTAAEIGFGWVGVANAPSTFPQLRAVFRHSQVTGAPLPVSNMSCERTVFDASGINVAFRFWHDTAHCRLGFSFELPDELELGLWLCPSWRRRGSRRTPRFGGCSTLTSLVKPSSWPTSAVSRTTRRRLCVAASPKALTRACSMNCGARRERQ